MLRRSARALAPLAPEAWGKKYDFVVLGAGSAGCVVARRLADTGARVLLVEAGGGDRDRWDWWKIAMPSALTYNLGDRRYNWDHWTTPQEGLGGRRIHQPRGKVLGGSSCLNAMAYVRGHALDYERWAEEIGSDAWRYRAVLPYFRRAQRHQLGSNAYRGGDGPLQVTRRHTPVTAPLNDAFVSAGQQAGYPFTDDMNGEQQEGFGAMDMTVTADGVRASTSHCYLRGMPERKNLEVVTGWRADTVHLQGYQQLRCQGVNLVSEDGAKTRRVQCGELIISLGAFGSPCLLQRSGVGSPELLKQHGIHCRVPNPGVGANLQDHLEFYIQYKSKRPGSLYPYAATYSLPGPLQSLSRYAFRQPWRAVEAGLSWGMNGAGVASSNHFEVGGFVRSRAGIRHPDIQYHFIAGCVDGQLDFIPSHGYQVHAGTMRPTSRGTVSITSSNAFAEPLIDPRYLTTEDDVADMRATVRVTHEILQQKAFEDFRGDRIKPLPDLDLGSDRAVDKWVREQTHSAYHPSCTCAMGSVVDGEGRVIGVDGVRVVDASVMPSMTSGNLNAPTIMLAERMSDSILGATPLPPADATWWEHPDWRNATKVTAA